MQRAGEDLLKREDEPTSHRFNRYVIAVFGKLPNLVKSVSIHTPKRWSGLSSLPGRLPMCCVNHFSLVAIGGGS